MVYLYILIFLLTLTTPCLNADSWKILFYMDSTDDLSDMAFKSITDMMRAQPQDHLELYIQLHAYNHSGLRYRITHKGLIFIDEITITHDDKQNLIDAAMWAFTETTCDHTMLILSNHGWGILEPEWDEITQKWHADTDDLSNQCFIKSSHDSHYKNHKGFMFNRKPRSYVSNHDLADALSYITTHALKEKKIDILAFDTCMGSMLEVGYQMAPYADYLLGVQSCALKDGFDYHNIITIVNQSDNDALTILPAIVAGFDRYYAHHDPSGIYTFAAIDLATLENVRTTLDHVIEQILAHPYCIELLHEARNLTPRFCLWPMYTDPVSFCTIIETLATYTEYGISTELITALHDFYTAVQTSVIARCGGHTTHDKAHGYSLYLPHGSTIHASYPQSLFARKSNWLSLLKQITSQPS